jgi:hypothetical protein
MVTRRGLLLGSAATLGLLGVARAATAAPGLARSALPAGAVDGFTLPGGLVCPVPFMTRAAWGADESLRYTNNGGYWPEEYYPVKALTVHHTGFATDPDPTVTVRYIYTRQTLSGDGSPGAIGWGDIGYNLLIDDQGVVYEGRYSGGDGMPVFNPDGNSVTGAHVLHYNTGNIGVCLLGFLDDTPATAAAQASLTTVLAYLAAVGPVNPTGSVNYVNAAPGYQQYTKTVHGVSGHRDWAATDCPGSAFYPLLGGIRSAAAAELPSVPKPTADATPTGTPSAGGSPTPTPSHTSSPTPHPSTSKPPTSRDRGGDEYVPVARSASPSAFPTKLPTATPKPKPTASLTPSPTPTFSMADAAPTTAVPAPVAGDVTGGGWGLGTTVAGVAGAGVLGSLGAWWWRRRRPAPALEPALAPGPVATGPVSAAGPAPATGLGEAGGPVPAAGPASTAGLAEESTVDTPD